METRKYRTVSLLVAGLIAHMHSGARAEEALERIDTQFIFGFTSGADVGELGEKEIEHETIGRFGKRSGSYVGLSDQLLAKFVPVKDFRFEIGLPFAYYDIAGVPGLDDIHRGAFDGLTACLPWAFRWTGVILAVLGCTVFGGRMNVGYHRLLTHRSFSCPRWMERSLAILGACCMEESPTVWAAWHRQHHHTADRERDPHSPLESFL
jgi:Fatty acid desaturase